MEIQKALSLFSSESLWGKTALQRLSLALRRGGVDTMEELSAIYQSKPQALEKLRDIGPKRMAMIDELLRIYDLRGPGPPGKQSR